MTDSVAMNLSKLPFDFEPVVYMIDDFNECERLGLVFEAKVGKGRLLATSLNLGPEGSRTPAQNQMLKSLLNYAGSDSFAPAQSLSIKQLEQIFSSENLVSSAKGGVLESFTSEYGDGWDASKLINGVTNETGWSSAENPTCPQEFVFSFRDSNSANLNKAVIHGGKAEGSYYSKDVEVWTSADGISFTKRGGDRLANNNGSTVTVDLTGIVAKKIKLAITSGYRSDYWELAEFLVNGDMID
jgi:hypothetical protein